MATEPKTTSSTTSSTTSTESSTGSSNRASTSGAGGDQRHRDGQRPGQVAEQARESAQGATAAVGQLVRQGQDDALAATRLGVELMARLNPFVLLSAAHQDEGSDERRGQLGRGSHPAGAWVDGVFDLVETALGTQRRYIDQVLAAQRQMVGQFLDAGAGIATATQAEVARTGVYNLDDARTIRR